MEMYDYRVLGTLRQIIACFTIGKKHYQEVEEEFHSLPYDPDMKAIEALYNSGMLSAVGAFDGPRLIGYVVNRVIPTELGTKNIPDYLRHRLDMQKGYLERIDELFSDQVLASIPEFERDITGLPMIEKVAEAMFGPIPETT